MPTSVCIREGCEAALEYKTSPRKWCDAHKPPKKHGVGYSMSTFCTMPDCGRPHQARGYCKMHYKRFVNRSDKTIKQCDACGSDCLKEGRQRYQRVYCSELCRQYDRFGSWSTRLPVDHIARNIGKTCRWRPPALAYECAWCGSKCEPARSTSRFCSRKCCNKFKKAKRRGVEAGAIGTYSWAEVTRLWLSFGKTCAYCRQPIPLSDVEAEHVQPLSRGGANNLTNLLPACKKCNSDKRDLLLAEWAADRARRGLPMLVTAWDDSDPLYQHLVTAGDLSRAA